MGHKGSCYDLCHSVLPMFSSKSFTASGLTNRSLIHLEFILVCGVRKCSNFILLHIVVHFFQCHLLKKLSFSHCIFLPLLSKITCPYMCGSKHCYSFCLECSFSSSSEGKSLINTFALPYVTSEPEIPYWTCLSSTPRFIFYMAPFSALPPFISSLILCH